MNIQEDRKDQRSKYDELSELRKYIQELEQKV